MSYRTPDRPLNEVINSLKSESGDSSLTTSLTMPITRPLRSLSETESHDLTSSLPSSAAAATPPRVEGYGGRDDQYLSAGRAKAMSMSSECSSEFDLQNSGSFAEIRAVSTDNAASAAFEHSITNGVSVSSPLTSSADFSSSVTDSDVLSPPASMPEATPSKGSSKVIPVVVLEEEKGKAGSQDSPSILGKGRSEKGRLTSTDSHNRQSSSHGSKVASASSSRGGSGSNTPRAQAYPHKVQGGSGTNTPKLHEGSGTNTPKHPENSGLNTPKRQSKSGSNTPRGQSSATPNPGKGLSSSTDTTPLSKPASKTVTRSLPPQTISKEYLAKKLEEIAAAPTDMTLPSPLYSQDERTLQKAQTDSVDGDDKAEAMPKGIYDPVSDQGDDEKALEEAVLLPSPDINDSHVQRRRKRHDVPAVRSIVIKPDLSDNNLRMFFKKVIADDSSEILMNITWGVSNLPSAPSCEIEVGTIISDRGVYLLEVLDPGNHRARPLSWATENFPLAKITCCYHSTLRKISIGIFDQSLTVESFDKGVVKRFVLFPHTYEKLNLFIENLKAAFDAYKLPYTVCPTEQGFVSGKAKGLIILNPGTEDMAVLKESLVWSQSHAEVGHSLIAGGRSESSSLTASFESNLRKFTKDTVGKFEIVQYVIVGVLSSDVLPISNGKLHVQSRALILTNDTIYLCKEEIDSWPNEIASIRTPPFPKCMVIDAHPIARISGIKVCDKSHPIISCTDPLYEFSISFEELDDIQVSPTLSAEWVLCVHDRQYLDQLLGCLTHLANEQQKENHRMIDVKRTSNRFPSPVSPKPPRQNQLDTGNSSRKDVSARKGGVTSNRGTSPCFFSSQALFDFSVLSNYQRLKFFKKHVAQAEFMKSDEVPLSVFLAHCSSSQSEYVEVEACVIVSNYAIYLLSCVDNIQLWVEAGASSPFPRRELLDRKDSDRLCCFYRLWLNKIKVVNIGVFYNSVSVTDVDEPDSCRFTIHTENPSATLSFLTALSCVVSLHDREHEQEMECLLSDYELVDDTGEEESPSKKADADEQHTVEFRYHSEDKLLVLKQKMAMISPAISKNAPRDVSSGMLKILYQQVMLLVDELRIRDILASRFYPHLVFLTNYGIYVCVNETSERCSPSAMDPTKLGVKKWCHIDLVDRVHVSSPSTSQYSCYNVVIYLRSPTRSSLSSDESNSISLLVQNSELLGCFLYQFSLMCQHKNGKQVSITRD